MYRDTSSVDCAPHRMGCGHNLHSGLPDHCDSSTASRRYWFGVKHHTTTNSVTIYHHDV